MITHARYHGDGKFVMREGDAEKLKIGGSYKLEITQPRSGPHHRMFWALASEIANALNAGPGGEWTPEAVTEWLKISTGHVEMLRLPPKAAAKYGTPIAARPKSIAFHNMDQIEFSAFFDAALRAALTELVPHMSEGELRARVEAVCSAVGPEPRQKRKAA